LRILVLNYEYPPVGGGGGQASADLARALADRGHSIQVITAGLPGLAARAEEHGVSVRRVATGRRSRFRASFLVMAGYLGGALLPALRLARSWKPDVIHAHFAVPTGALALVVSRLTGAPYVLTAHLGDVPGGVPEKTGRWFRWVYPFTGPIWRGAAAVAAVSEYTRGLAAQHYPVPIVVIPNGVPIGKADSVRPCGQPPRIVFVGRFQPQKNLLFLVDTLGEVRDLGWRCTLVGDGPLRSQVEQRIAGLDLTARIELTGWVAPEEAARRLSEADLLLMPSLSEGLPVVGIQALSHGLAIVASRVGGLAELVEDGANGWACDPGDAAGFRAALRASLEDPQRLLRMKQASKSMAVRYDIRRVAEAYEALLGEASRARRAKPDL
jgi:glycosyltransferase involved in cell wall biosynthesis